VIEKLKNFFARLFIRLISKSSDTEVRVLSEPVYSKENAEKNKKLGIKPVTLEEFLDGRTLEGFLADSKKK